MIRKRSDDNGAKKRLPTGAAVMQPDVTEALVRAFFAVWAETGYAALGLERVAARAGVGKAALYRRWPSKAAMAHDCLARVALDVTDVADTGSLRGDVRHFLQSVRRVLRHRRIRAIVLDLHAEIGRNPDLAAAVRPVQEARRTRALSILDCAIARGELSPTADRAIAADLLGAPVYWRLAVTGGVADTRYLDRLTTALCAALHGLGTPMSPNGADVS